MTAMAMKVKQSPMAPYMSLMQGMNREQKLAVVAFLVDSMQDEEEEAQLRTSDEEEEVRQRTSDEEFVKELLALRYDGEMSAEEMKQMLRESHHFGGRNIKPLYDEE
jgi:PleD family two-component response regulator